MVSRALAIYFRLIFLKMLTLCRAKETSCLGHLSGHPHRSRRKLQHRMLPQRQLLALQFWIFSQPLLGLLRRRELTFTRDEHRPSHGHNFCSRERAVIEQKVDGLMPRCFLAYELEGKLKSSPCGYKNLKLISKSERSSTRYKTRAAESRQASILLALQGCFVRLDAGIALQYFGRQGSERAKISSSFTKRGRSCGLLV